MARSTWFDEVEHMHLEREPEIVRRKVNVAADERRKITSEPGAEQSGDNREPS